MEQGHCMKKMGYHMMMMGYYMMMMGLHMMMKVIHMIPHLMIQCQTQNRVLKMSLILQGTKD